ncbi:MAG: hypothetical protein A2X86_02205 [Bdellovibrionales bacterium GWA2_49_15]|nr:MAG: hypothetical protein A2X86_02205 [Bdellovibrionales bacterium GWA2_49_15]
MKKIVSWFTVCACIVVTLVSLILTLPMSQENPEKLFLRDQQLQDFELYTKKIEEREIVVGLVKSQQSLLQNLELSDDLAAQLADVLSDQQVTIHSFRTFFGKMFSSTIDPLALSEKIEKIVGEAKLLPLLDQKHIAHLFVLVPNLTLRDKNSILQHIKTVYAKGPNPYFLSGPTVINQGLNEQSNQIKNRLFPLMFMLCFFLLWGMTGKMLPTLVIFVPSLMASGLSLLSIYLLFGSMNMINSVLPLFTFAINASLGLHLLFSLAYSENFNSMIKFKTTPICLMMGTTFIGLISLVVSDLAIIRQFALLAAGLTVLTSVTHLAFAWAFYALFPNTPRQARPLQLFNRWQGLLPPTRLTFWVLTLLTVIGTLAIPSIRLETEAAHYFNQEKHPVGQGIKEIGGTIFGNPNMDIILEKTSAPWSMADLEKIHQLENKLLSALGPHYKILSPNQFLLEANAISGVGRSLPSSLLSYPIILGQILGDTNASYYQDHLYRMTLMGPTLGTLEFTAFDKLVAQLLKAEEPWGPISYQLTGTSYNLKRSQLNLVSILALSFLSSLVVITLSAFFISLQRKIRPTLIFFAVNLFPLLTTCLFIKIFNLSFNIATVMTFSIALGLVVDGTFHLQHAHAHLPREQIWPSVKYPIWASTLVLTLSFAILAMNQFLPIREFALVLVMSIFLGMIFDLYFLDAAIRLFTPKGELKD